MKHGMWVSTLLVFALISVNASAQEVIPAPAPTTIVAGSEVRVPAQRSGLFSRVRNRNSATNVATSSTTVVPPMVLPAGAVVPAPVTSSTTQIIEQRPGLGARLRARFGRN